MTEGRDHTYMSHR